jgi:hypothetical protein
MIFWGEDIPDLDYQVRYCTEEEARVGHQAAVIYAEDLASMKEEVDGYGKR